MNTSTLYHLFLQAILIILALAMYAGGRFRDISEFAHVPEWIPLILLVMGFNIFILIVRTTAFKRELLQLTQNPPVLRSTEPADFPQLDAQAFDHVDTQLTSLGFKPRFCFTSHLPLSAKELTRLYYHPVHRCFATNTQMFQGDTKMAMACINSELVDGWLLSTANRKPNPVNCLWRRPRALLNAIPGGEPSELLNAHLQLRQRMIDGLGVDIVASDMDLPAYFEFSTRNHRQRHEQIRKKTAILLYLEYEFYKRKPIYTWMGDLEKVEGARRS